MGFLSSLFDFGDKPTTKTSNIMPQYPEELKPNIQEITDASKTIYDQRLAEGYQPYTGQTIAGFTPEEVASQEGLKSLVGTQAPLQQEALDIARGTDRQFTPEVAQQYMSPYLRTALDAQKAEAQRQYERSQRPQFEADAVRAGGMSGLGTRAAVESAEREVGQQRLLANIEAAGQQKAFESAQDAFKDQTARERQAAAQISTAAPNIFKSGLAEQGLLQTMGEQKRDLAQSSLDEAYLKYVEQQQFPEQQLARYQSSIYGNPLLKQPSYSTTGTTTGGGPGLGKTLLGLGTAALGFGGSGGIGSSIFKGMTGTGAGGGQVGGLTTLYRQNGGNLRDEDVEFQTAKNRSRQDTDAANAAAAALAIPAPAVAAPNVVAPVVAPPQPKPAVDKPKTLTPLSSDQPGAATADNALKMIGNKLTIDFPALTAGIRKQYTDDSTTSKQEIESLNKESSEFQERSIARINDYKSFVMSLTGNDPNEYRSFWFTVSAAVMKPGNGWANLMGGLKEATLASSASREKKNKLLMMLSKDEMNFKNDLDKIASASTRSSIKLNAKQERTLNSLPKAIRDEAIRMMTAGASYNNAMAAAAKASGVTASEMRKLASLDNTTRNSLMKRAAVRFGFTLNAQGDFQGTGSQKLREEQVKPALELYYAMAKAYGSTTDRVKGMKLADKVLQKSLGKIGTGNSSSSKKSKLPDSGSKITPPPPAGFKKVD